MFKSLRISFLLLSLTLFGGIGHFVKNDYKHTIFSKNTSQSLSESHGSTGDNLSKSEAFFINSLIRPYISTKTEAPLFHTEVEEEEEDFSVSKKGYKQIQFALTYEFPRFFDWSVEPKLGSFHATSKALTYIPLYLTLQVFLI
ncbi:hypothetical protein [Aquirufa rosea]|uniref:Uncharacterized protein n=1 Tax=Aquirufa rosea TaxID=2509241 RepID=A0A4Q1C2M2_9BACT|nr:hypothetical protein [Aquirufa rosea]RXK52399.1 hypothetical protein ESB04_01750 [Aquirufa rosea]